MNRIVRQKRAQLGVDVAGVLRFGSRGCPRSGWRRWRNCDRAFGRGLWFRPGAWPGTRRCSPARPRTRRRTGSPRNRRGAGRARIWHSRAFRRQRRRAYGGRRARCGARSSDRRGRRGRAWQRWGRRGRSGRRTDVRSRLGRWARRRRARRNRRRCERRRRLQRYGDGADGRDAYRRRGQLITRLRLENVLRWLGIGLRRLLRDRTRVGGRRRSNLGQLVPVDRQALALRLRQRCVLQRCDRTNVWNGRHGMNCSGLIRDDDRRGARNRDDFPALDAFRGALLRRTHEHGEEQRCQQRVKNQRG